MNFFLTTSVLISTAVTINRYDPQEQKLCDLKIQSCCDQTSQNNWCQPQAPRGPPWPSAHPVPSLHTLIHCFHQKHLKTKSLQENDNWHCSVDINSTLTIHLWGTLQMRSHSCWEVSCNPRRQLVAETGYKPINLAWKLTDLTLPLRWYSLTMNDYGNTTHLTRNVYPPILITRYLLLSGPFSFSVKMKTQPPSRSVITCHDALTLHELTVHISYRVLELLFQGSKNSPVKGQTINILDLGGKHLDPRRQKPRK